MATLLELSEQDAAKFRLFMEHYQEFELLLTAGVFDVRNGSAEVHFNNNGDIASIDIHAKVFRRESIPQPPVVIMKSVL